MTTKRSSRAWYKRNAEAMRTKYSDNREEVLSSRKVRYIAKRDEILKYISNYRKTPKGRFIAARASAKVRKIYFRISLQNYSRLIQQSCFVTNCFNKVTGLDRIDSSKGYRISNVRPSCHRHNSMMNDMTDRETYKKAKEFVVWFESTQEKKKKVV